MTTSEFFERYQRVSPIELRACLASYATLTRPTQTGAPTLARMERLLTELGQPHKELRVIHVAGTSGKGSVTTLIARLLQTQGFKTGMTASPHVRDLRERLQIDGTMISAELLCVFLQKIFSHLTQWAKRGEQLPHYFELMTALALYWFHKEQVDYVVLETGIGGRFDASNSVRALNKICVFTPIDLDHQRLLGDTRAKIALEKAGIMSEEGLAWSAPQSEEVKEVLIQVATHKRVQMRFVELLEANNVEVSEKGTFFTEPSSLESIPRRRLNLFGVHQAQNAVLALAVLRGLAHRDQRSIDERSIDTCLDSLTLPARFERYALGKRSVIVDGAHNPHKFESLLETVLRIFPDEPLTLILGLSTVDHAFALAELFSRYSLQIVLADFQVGDQFTAYKLADVDVLATLFKERGCPVRIIKDLSLFLKDPVTQSSPGPLIISGSFYLASHTLSILDQIC